MYIVHSILQYYIADIHLFGKNRGSHKCLVQPDAEFSAGCTCGVAAKFPQVMMWRVFSLETTSSHAAMRHAHIIAGTAVPVGWVHELQRCFLKVFRCLSVAFKGRN